MTIQVKDANGVVQTVASLDDVISAIEDAAVDGYLFLGPNATKRLLSSTADTNPNVVLGAPGRVWGIQGYNAAGAVRYLKFFNKVTAPTVGTDTPVKTIPLPALTAFDLDLHAYHFDTGIGIGIVSGSADNSNGALAVGDILGLNIDYRAD